MGINSLYLILGCFGRIEEDFTSCCACRNKILCINTSTYNYDKIVDYLDNYRLFDKMLMDYNAIRHFVINLQDKFDTSRHPLWSDKMFKVYQKFIIDHRDCGIFIDLELENNEDN